MADSEPTRTETVTANIAAVIEQYSDENYNRIMSVCLQDISLSLAMLVDASSSST